MHTYKQKTPIINPTKLVPYCVIISFQFKGVSTEIKYIIPPSPEYDDIIQ